MAAYKAPKIGKENFLTRKTKYGINHDAFGTSLTVQTSKTGSVSVKKSPDYYGIQVIKKF